MTQNPFHISTYDYLLPDGKIAENAVHPPESAKMLCFDRKTNTIEHRTFSEFPSFLDENTLIFFNDTRVIPSRVHFFGIPFTFGEETRFRDGEIFFLEALSPKIFKALIFPGKQFKEWTRIDFPGFSLRVQSKIPEGRILEIVEGGDITDFLQKFGKLPLPPYVEYSDEKAKDYQTAFARHDGSLAAPTASLHFSSSLLEQIHTTGTDVDFFTLHVGLGTFIGMKTEDIREHIMHGEYFSVPLRIFSKIALAKTQSKRIVAVGTTVIRTLESLGYMWSFVRSEFFEDLETLHFWDEATADIMENPFVERMQITSGEVSGYTKLFITPGFHFRVVSEIVTNFHLPKTTLMVLVSAFAGIIETQKLYHEALKGDYRFFSFWDGMWIR